MTSYRVTIRDIQTWTITLRATDSIAAENAAEHLYASASDRGAHFEEDNDLTVQTEEVSR
jgi:hypothetical protein